MSQQLLNDIMHQCNVSALTILFFTIEIGASQSQCIQKAIHHFIKEIFVRKSFKYSTSKPASSRATNSSSIIDLAMIVCLADFQDIATSPKVNTYLLVHFASSKS